MINLSVLAKFSLNVLMQIGWQPGIGDRALMGWLTVLFYLLVGTACWFHSRTAVFPTNFRPQRDPAPSQVL